MTEQTAPEPTAPQTGEQAPDLTLPDQDGQPFTLSDLRGRSAALLVFYPFAFSGICTGELCSLRDDLASFQQADVQVVGVSCDPRFAQKAWAQQEGYDFPLLSDFWPHGEVSRRYGVFRDDLGFAVRGSFLVDREGVLRWAVVNGPGEARDPKGYQEAVAALGA